MGTMTIQTRGRKLNCGKCPTCTDPRCVEQLGNGRCYCRCCGKSWTPRGGNYNIETDR